MGRENSRITLLLAGKGRQGDRRTDMIMKPREHHRSRCKKVLYFSISSPVSFLKSNPPTSHSLWDEHMEMNHFMLTEFQQYLLNIKKMISWTVE